MSGGTLWKSLDAAGYRRPDGPASSDSVGLSRLEAGNRDTVGTLKAPPLLHVPTVPTVPTGKTESCGSDGDARTKTAAGPAGTVGDDSARTSAGERLRVAAAAEGLDPVRVVGLNDADPCDLERMTGADLCGYARALIQTDARRAGRVPEGWTQPAECEGCGPVWLWPGVGRLVACPWCWNRYAGLPVPRPPHGGRPGAMGPP